MTRHQFLTLALGIATAFCMGCDGRTAGTAASVDAPVLENPDAVAARLPSGITLDTHVTDLEGDSSETVKEALARLQTKVKNGKLIDVAGREVQFYSPTSKGLQVKYEKEYNRLRKRGTVLLVAH